MMRTGITAPKLPPVPEYRARVTKRADTRARLVLDDSGDADRLNALPGVLLIIEADYETLAAEVYASHEGGTTFDVNLRGGLDAATDAIVIRRTGLGRTA